MLLEVAVGQLWPIWPGNATFSGVEVPSGKARRLQCGRRRLATRLPLLTRSMRAILQREAVSGTLAFWAVPPLASPKSCGNMPPELKTWLSPDSTYDSKAVNRALRRDRR
jgi:hypothetical protein